MHHPEKLKNKSLAPEGFHKAEMLLFEPIGPDRKAIAPADAPAVLSGLTGCKVDDFAKILVPKRTRHNHAAMPPRALLQTHRRRP
jgi:hypothetical protein